MEYDKSNDNKECKAKVENCKDMIEASTTLCETCNMEYNISDDNKKCTAKVNHCKDMIIGSITLC